MLSVAITLQVALEAPPAGRPVQPKVLADKGIGHEIKPKEEEKKKKYEDIREVKDNTAKASALSPQMARVICWNVPNLYQQKAQRLL